MKSNFIKLDMEEMMKGSTLVESPKPIPLYVGGKPTEEMGSVGYSVLLPNCGYEKIVVKIAHTTPAIEFDGTPVRVEFRNLEGKVWYDYKSNEIKVSATAESIAVAPNKLKMSKTEEA